MAATAHERLAAARAAVDRASELLLFPAPAQMDECAHLFESAISELRMQPDGIPRKDAIEQARLLKRSIGHARQLLEGAAAFHRNWIRCLNALCAGYTREGQPAVLPRGARLLGRG